MVLSGSVPVLMMNVRHMGMAVGNRLMTMGVGMRLGAIPGKIMIVLVMFVMHMRMGVMHSCMRMNVHMLFSQVKPDASRHEKAGDPEAGTRNFLQHQQRDCRAHKGRRGKIGAGAGRTEIAQCQHEEHQAQTVAAKADDAGA